MFGLDVKTIAIILAVIVVVGSLLGVFFLLKHQYDSLQDTIAKKDVVITDLQSTIATKELDIQNYKLSLSLKDKELEEKQRNINIITKEIEINQGLIQQYTNNVSALQQHIFDKDRNDKIARIKAANKDLTLLDLDNKNFECIVQNIDKKNGKCIRGKWIND